jgi:hypothetical protein
MQSLGWTRASYVAAMAAGAITCLVVGMLAGVLVGGGHPHNVLQVITDPAPAASAHDLQPGSHHRPPPAASTTTVSSTVTVTAAATTVTAPAQTVTETATETVTESAPTTAEQTTAP